MNPSLLIAAFSQATRDLLSPAVIWRIVWPPIVALVICIVGALSVWEPLLGWIEPHLPALPWSDASWFPSWAARWVAIFLMLLGFGVIFYMMTMLLVAVVVLPGLINHVALRHYPGLGRHGENVFWGSLATTLVALSIYVVGGLLSLPLLLIPGMVLVLPLVWNAWINQRTFRYDALAEHASPAELKQLTSLERGTFFLAGLGCAALSYVPFINLLVPGFTALVFVHLGLQRLQALRQKVGVQL